MSREHPLTKKTITRLFVGALAAAAAGLVLVLVAVWAAFASDVAVTVTLVGVGSLALLAATVAAIASWVGALFNTAQLDDKLWFASLLVLGLFGVGVLAMAAYVLYGPDGTAPAGTPPALIPNGTEAQS